MEKKTTGFILIAILIALLVSAIYISLYPDLILPSTETTTTLTQTTSPPTPTTAPAQGSATTTTVSSQTPTTQRITTTTQAPVDTGTFQPSAVTLEIKSWGFNPEVVTLMKGSTATWTNLDSTKHTVTSTGNFDSADIAAGETWTYTFNKVGTFDYSCKYNPSMTAKVVITES